MNQREIKFRAWDKKKREMFEVWSFSPDLLGIVANKKEMILLSEPIENYELMQRVGLKDKEGIEIYQGDCFGGIWEGLYVDWCDMQGGWELFTTSDKCMACSGDVHWDEFMIDDKNRKIIGNIYEDANLLE